MEYESDGATMKGLGGPSLSVAGASGPLDVPAKPFCRNVHAVHWTPEMDETLRTLWFSRVSQTGIASRLGIHESSVRRRIKSLNLPPRAPVLAPNVWMGLWAKEDDELLRSLWSSNTALRDICRQLGRSNSSVVARARRMELPFRRKPEKLNALVAAVHRGVISLDSWPANSGCVFPIGDLENPDFHFCGAPISHRADGTARPYCQTHASICYVPAKPHKRKEAA